MHRVPIQLIRLSILFLSSILAHELGGGNFIQTKLLFTEVIFISLALFILREIELIGPNLALIVVITQSMSHFILGAGEKTGELSMSLSHILSGFLAYKLVSSLESIWNFLGTLLGYFLDVPAFEVFNFQGEKRLVSPIGTVRLVPSIFTSTYRLRAPPRLGAEI